MNAERRIIEASRDRTLLEFVPSRTLLTAKVRMALMWGESSRYIAKYRFPYLVKRP